MACGICRCSGAMVKRRKNLFHFKFLCAVLFFPPEKSLPYLLCILGAGHFLIYFAVKNVKYDEGNASKASVVTQGNAQNQTEPEG